MNHKSRELFEYYLEDARKGTFSGWDFDYVTRTKRIEFGPLNWNYFNIALPYLKESKALLDIGTGGGEILSRFAPLPQVTCATEAYPPNVEVARKRLGPLGVKVFQIDEKYPNNEVLPFENETFDLVINRHASYYPQELMRILKPQGMFITQQVGQGIWNLKKVLTGKDKTVTNWNLGFLKDGLSEAGFQILEAREDTQLIRIYDVGAAAYWLQAIPWIIDGFNIDAYADKLWELHLMIMGKGYFDTSYDAFLLKAQKIMK